MIDWRRVERIQLSINKITAPPVHTERALDPLIDSQGFHGSPLELCRVTFMINTNDKAQDFILEASKHLRTKSL